MKMVDGIRGITHSLSLPLLNECHNVFYCYLVHASIEHFILCACIPMFLSLDLSLFGYIL